ncbi:MAG: zinc-ribbon domain containing protein [Patescibacteria group bacterium]
MSEVLKDKPLECQDCGTTFIWDVAEQAYYKKKGFKEVPRRCRACRAKKKIEQEIEKSKEKELTCLVCGKTGTTSTEVSPDEEAMCLDCYVKQEVATAIES